MTYNGRVWLAVDILAAAVFFNVTGVTVSTMSGLVRDGKDGPLELQGWQRAFLRWLASRLGRAHVARALAHDRARNAWVVTVTGDSSPPAPG